MAKVDKLKEMFTSIPHYEDFKQRYHDLYKTDLEIEYFGWDGVADDISEEIGRRGYEKGEYVEIEIPWVHTRSGRTELIFVDELVEVPVMTEDEDYVGEYKFG